VSGWREAAIAAKAALNHSQRWLSCCRCAPLQTGDGKVRSKAAPWRRVWADDIDRCRQAISCGCMGSSPAGTTADQIKHWNASVRKFLRSVVHCWSYFLDL